jgi:hypothetical protein
MLPPEAIQEFKIVWREEFGEEIDDDFAREKATNLLELFALISQVEAPSGGNNHDDATNEKFS